MCYIGSELWESKFDGLLACLWQWSYCNNMSIIIITIIIIIIAHIIIVLYMHVL